CGIESCQCPSANYAPEKGRLMTPDRAAWWIEERDRQIDRVREAIARDAGFAAFVNEGTNFLTGEFRGPIERLPDFPHCYLALARIIIRADGSMFPCVMTASQRRNPLGNIHTSDGASIRAAMREYYELRPGRCRGRADCCNIDGVKNLYMREADLEPVLAS